MIAGSERIWFDSGCTHTFTLEDRPDLKWPADVYLEGSDQHRGWFHSSLLLACALYDRAPYRGLLTHGFTVDSQTLPAGVVETHVSLFDGSNSGIALTDRPAFSFQGHPEASPGPHDIGYLFDRFTSLMETAKARSA